MASIQHFQSTQSLLPTVERSNFGLQHTKSEFISSSMLRHGNPQISFTKAQRFKTSQSASSTDFFVPNRNLGRTTNFGYGNKKIFYDWVMNNATNYPSPNKYHTGAELVSPKKGKSFGLSYKYQAKKYTEHQPNYIDPECSKNIPGPGTYEIQKQPGHGKMQKTMSERREMYRPDYNPAANLYRPKFDSQKNSRFNRITFGVGTKFDFTKSVTMSNPGPGTYKAPSPFDKYEKTNFLKQRKLVHSRKKPSKSQSQPNIFNYQSYSSRQNFSEHQKQSNNNSENVTYNNMNSYNQFKQREMEKQREQQLQLQQQNNHYSESDDSPQQNPQQQEQEQEVESQQQQQQ